ncbi:hypothetical protein [Budvicia diplopodorum]|uniref:hypothetical protein n=1 Tax=Budvicia diplopodorum TaxID=1119056 RepID=UPI00135C516E|nr:hypothetical protein [Budvicia diplopodorum]
MKMKNWLYLPFIMACCSSSVVAATYYLNGNVSGYYTGENPKVCQIAINATGNANYKNQWHFSGSSSICSTAKAAFYLNHSVGVTVNVNGGANDSNNIVSIVIKDPTINITWPPYHKR